MAKRKYSSEARMEAKDSGMIHNETSKFANLPTEVMMKPFPSSDDSMYAEYPDNIHGIDKQIASDNSKRRGGMSAHKY